MQTSHVCVSLRWRVLALNTSRSVVIRVFRKLACLTVRHQAADTYLMHVLPPAPLQSTFSKKYCSLEPHPHQRLFHLLFIFLDANNRGINWTSAFLLFLQLYIQFEQEIFEVTRDWRNGF